MNWLTQVHLENGRQDGVARVCKCVVFRDGIVTLCPRDPWVSRRQNPGLNYTEIVNPTVVRLVTDCIHLETYIMHMAKTGNMLKK